MLLEILGFILSPDSLCRGPGSAPGRSPRARWPGPSPGADSPPPSPASPRSSPRRCRMSSLHQTSHTCFSIHRWIVLLWPNKQCLLRLSRTDKALKEICVISKQLLFNICVCTRLQVLYSLHRRLGFAVSWSLRFLG